MTYKKKYKNYRPGKGFNLDPKIVDQRVKALVITKLQEAQLWFSKLG